jgi:hypothetical protein
VLVVQCPSGFESITALPEGAAEHGDARETLAQDETLGAGGVPGSEHCGLEDSGAPEGSALGPPSSHAGASSQAGTFSQYHPHIIIMTIFIIIMAISNCITIIFFFIINIIIIFIIVTRIINSTIIILIIILIIIIVMISIFIIILSTFIIKFVKRLPHQHGCPPVFHLSPRPDLHEEGP